ncbi:MAG: hydrogenase expression/formation protein HypE [bacterium]|nr:hydrogenase expression/formation protein HypE [bacterium]
MSEKRITLAYGSGGRLTHQLIKDIFVKYLGNEILYQMNDSATFTFSGNLAFTTDSYVVNPIFFPGGDIGKLAIYGTVNDLAMVGAEPLYISLGIIIEEGLLFEELERIVLSIKEAIEEAGVKVVTGDTKVVEKGKADKVFINTSGIGVIPNGINIRGDNAKPGEVVIVSGTVGDHGIAILSARKSLSFSVDVKSDTAPLNRLVKEMIEAVPEISVLRDPTRGGFATTLNEIAQASNVGIEIEESEIPIKDSVRSACELLGIDPLYIANEGKLIAIVPESKADLLLRVMKNSPYGKDAKIIGRVTREHPGKVVLITRLGVRRLLDMLSGDPLPRIC